MATKKAATKKVAKKPTKKTVAKKATQKTTKSKVELVSFECSAVIPTQQYGNIQPKIVVNAPSIEEAKDVVMPMIEDLYKTYAETPLSGRDPKFYGKVSVAEKTVEAPAAVNGETAAKGTAPDRSTAGTPGVAAQSSQVEKTAEESQVAQIAQTPAQTAAPTPTEPTAAPAATPEPVLKATKAINLTTSKEALALVRNQIENSVKIAPDFKPDLLALCDEKYKELDRF